jgi:uncharacterized protein YjbJ (UPF0337 family)
VMGAGVAGTSQEALSFQATVFLMKGSTMDKDRLKGMAHQVKGGLKEKAGKAMGDKKVEGEGKGEKAAGKVQNTVGGVKDSLRGK